MNAFLRTANNRTKALNYISNYYNVTSRHRANHTPLGTREIVILFLAPFSRKIRVITHLLLCPVIKLTPLSVECILSSNLDSLNCHASGQREGPDGLMPRLTGCAVRRRSVRTALLLRPACCCICLRLQAGGVLQGGLQNRKELSDATPRRQSISLCSCCFHSPSMGARRH